jgi:plasmid stabilization system protein ParE
MPAYTVEFAAEVSRDFELIFDFLEQSYRDFGESPEDAALHAAARVEAIRQAGAKLGSAPYRGTGPSEMIPNLRHVTIDKAIYWFLVDEQAFTVRILAIFFGGQDHIRRMLARLLQRS